MNDTAEKNNRAFLDALPDLMVTIRRDGTLVECRGDRNRQFSETWEKMRGRKIWDVLGSARCEVLWQALKRAFATSTSQSFEGPAAFYPNATHEDTRIIPIDADAALLVVRDISARADADHVREELETLFRSTFEQASVGMAHISPEGKFMRVNAFFLRMMGYREEALLGKSVEDVSQPEDAGMVNDYLQRMLADTARDCSWDKRFRRHNGSECWGHVTMRLLRESTGRPKYFITIIEDVGERKRTEAVLRRSEERFRGLFESSLVGITFISTDRAVMEVNDALLGILGFTREELNDKSIPWKSLTPKEFIPVREAMYAELEASGGAGPTEMEFFRKDGTRAPVAVVATRLKESPNVNVTFTIDRTEAREAERRLAEQQAQIIASSKMSTLGEMAGGIAHEINNPLAIIHGKAGQLRDLGERGELDHAAVMKTAEKIEATAMRISKIVKSLRAFSREEDAEPTGPVAVATLMEDTLELCRERFRNYGIDLRIGPLPEGLELEGRPTQLSQVMINLLSNAFDAAAEGRDEKWVRVDISATPELVELAVTDCGPGIPEAIRQKIMQPFFTTKEIGKGTGLGLSIARGIIGSHHGELLLDESSPQTRFVVRLPRTQPRKTSGGIKIAA